MKIVLKLSGIAVSALLSVTSVGTANAAHSGDVQRASAATRIALKSPVLFDTATSKAVVGLAQAAQDPFAAAGLPVQLRDPGARIAQAQNVPLSVVLRNIRSRYPGKHLDTRLNGNKYKVIWLTPDGRRLDILADARTGNIISVRGD